MRQAPFGILHYSIYSSQASGRARCIWDPRYQILHACRRECTAVLPAAWLTGGYLRLGVGYTLNGLPAAHYSARLPCARARCGVHQSMRCTCLLSTSPLTIHIHTHHLYCTKYAPVASYGCQLTRLAGLLHAHAPACPHPLKQSRQAAVAVARNRWIYARCCKTRAGSQHEPAAP